MSVDIDLYPNVFIVFSDLPGDLGDDIVLFQIIGIRYGDINVVTRKILVVVKIVIGETVIEISRFLDDLSELSDILIVTYRIAMQSDDDTGLFLDFLFKSIEQVMDLDKTHPAIDFHIGTGIVGI